MGTVMALKSGIAVDHDTYFHGTAYVIPPVQPVVKWSDDGERQGQDLDKVTGHPLWEIRVIDADPEARKGQNELVVKLASIAEPELPAEIPGTPFRPVVFEGLTVVPYVKETGGRPRVAFSLRATSMHPPVQPKPRGGE